MKYPHRPAYNPGMRIFNRHAWQVTTARAREIQQALAGEIAGAGTPARVRLVAGIDVSINRFAGTGTAAVVVLDYPSLSVIAVQTVTDTVPFPYVPGLLSFREAPLILRACELLEITPDLVFVDGQGIAHPRRLGLAAHLGLFLDVPTIGCAKSRLFGTPDEPPGEAGGTAPLMDGDEIIGSVVRTKTGVKPLYISIGNNISLDAAVAWTFKCCRGYRLPEPTRLAHQAAGGHLHIG